MEIFVLYILYFIVITYVVLTIHKPFFLNPFHVSLFFLSNMLLGTMVIFDFSLEADRVYFYLMVMGILSLMLGNIVGKIFFPTKKIGKKWYEAKIDQVEGGIVFDYLVYALIGFSVFVCIAYFMAIGYNMIVLGVASLASGAGGVEDAATLRLNSYQTTQGNYFAPGYVNQFKNLLLPILVGYLWGKKIVSKRGNTFSKILLILLSILSVGFLLGTGQRGGFVNAYIMVLLFIYTIVEGKKVKFRILFANVFVILGLFGAMSIVIGRTSVEDEGSMVSSTINAFWSRITEANQESGLIGFRYVYEKPMQWGNDWKDSFLGILPSHSGNTLAGEIAHVMWGGHRGTAPVTIWGSIYYNFGTIGIVVIPIFLGFFHQYIYHRLFRGSKSFLLRTAIYASGIYIIGSWVIGAPMAMLNQGLMAIVFLRFLFIVFLNIFGKKVYRLN